MAGAKEQLSNVFTLTADANLASYMNYPVTVNGAAADAGAELCDAATEVPVGVIVGFTVAGASGDYITVAGPGSIVKVKVGAGGVTRGTQVKVVTASGAITDLAGGGGAGQYAYLGQALETGVENDLVLVLVAPGQTYYGA